MSIKSQRHAQNGQTLVEFALVIILFLLLVTFVIEAGRIIWAYGVVQNAAREGARYAITGGSDITACNGLDSDCLARTQSVINTARGSMTGLRINESEQAIFQDDNFTLIQVFGYNASLPASERLQEGYAGDPGQPVIVRVTYNVPMVTPLLRPIVENVPVYGQVTLNNELFGQTGGTTEGVALPPPLPAVPQPGPTDTPTPTFTPTLTPTIDPAATATPTLTLTPIPRCNVRIINDPLIEEAKIIIVTGDLYRNNDPGQGVYSFDLIDVTNGRTIVPNVTMTAIPDADVGIYDHGCTNGNEGVAVIDLTAVGVDDYVNGVKLFTLVVADHQNGTQDQKFVEIDPNRASPTPLPPTQTPIPTDTPSPTPTETATPNTPDAFIALLSGGDCVTLSPTARFEIIGSNWQPNASLRFEWQGIILPNQVTADGLGQVPLTTFDLAATNGLKFLRAFDLNSGDSYSLAINIPCPTDPPTPSPTPSPTLVPADLIISQPQLLSQGPLFEFEQVVFGFTVTNTGQTDANALFFVDLYLDPDASAFITVTNPITSTAIETDPHSDGFVALGSLGAGVSQAITITSKSTGFRDDTVGDRKVYGMVDSLLTIEEEREDNNISSISGIQVTPANSPTPTPELGGTNIIGGVVNALYTTFVPQQRAIVYLVETVSNSSQVVGVTVTNVSGGYVFTDVPELPSPTDTYTIVACLNVAGGDGFVGSRDAVPSPSGPVIKNIFMILESAGCPY
ncbi:MAG: TadE family protein [Chloroflexota bacterium]